MGSFFSLFFFCVAFAKTQKQTPPPPPQKPPVSYRIGVAKADITGQILGQGMMGYGLPDHKTRGIHSRLYARVFLIEDNKNKARVAFAILDQAFVTKEMKQDMLLRLSQRGVAGIGHSNFLLSATHTHSGPGGYLHPPLYNFTTLGFNSHDYNQIVDGVVDALEKAQQSMRPGYLRYGEGELADISVNRSKEAFQANPESRFMKSDIDPQMAELVFLTQDDRMMGMINWFAIHPTSLSSKNHLISGDSKGIASALFEREFPGSVAAYANSDEGDISPVRPAIGNLEGVELERAQAFVLGRAQFEKSKQILFNSTVPMDLPLEVSSIQVDMPGYVVSSSFTKGKEHELCPSAMGLSFVAGAEDGRSHFSGYVEGLRQGDPFDPSIGFQIAFLLFSESFSKSSGPMLECHSPKPIWLSTGSHHPKWTYDRLEFQLIRIGQLVLIAVPSELSVMAGHLLKEQVSLDLRTNQATRDVSGIVIAGLSNGYSHYVTTKEEYDMQQYEGASTLFGPYTFSAYKQIFNDLVLKLSRPDAKIEKAEELTPRELPFELPRWLKSFFWGPSKLQFLSQKLDQNVLEAEFQTSNPNLDGRLGKSFIEVQKKAADGQWQTFFSDNDPETTLEWIESNRLRVRVQLPVQGEYRVLVSQDFERNLDQVFSESVSFK